MGCQNMIAFMQKLRGNVDSTRINFPKVALYLSPLLVVYLTVVIVLSTNTFQGDEKGYLEYSQRLLSGLYFSNPLDIRLWWGPG